MRYISPLPSPIGKRGREEGGKGDVVPFGAPCLLHLLDFRVALFTYGGSRPHLHTFPGAIGNHVEMPYIYRNLLRNLHSRTSKRTVRSTLIPDPFEGPLPSKDPIVEGPNYYPSK